MDCRPPYVRNNLPPIIHLVLDSLVRAGQLERPFLLPGTLVRRSAIRCHHVNHVTYAKTRSARVFKNAVIFHVERRRQPTPTSPFADYYRLPVPFSFFLRERIFSLQIYLSPSLPLSLPLLSLSLSLFFFFGLIDRSGMNSRRVTLDDELHAKRERNGRQ